MINTEKHNELVESLPRLTVAEFQRGVQMMRAQMKSGEVTEEQFLFAKSVLFETVEMQSEAVN